MRTNTMQEHMKQKPKRYRRFRYGRTIKMTGRARLVEDDGGQYWLPNSHAWHGQYAAEEGPGFDFVDLPEWLAEQKGMTDEITELRLDTYRIVF